MRNLGATGASPFRSPYVHFSLLAMQTFSAAFMNWYLSQLPVLVLLVGNISLYQHHAATVSTEYHDMDRTNLIVIDKVRPRHDMRKQRRIPAIPYSHTLHVWCQITLAVQRFSFLHLVDHFPHIHLNFSAVLGITIESYWFMSATPFLGWLPYSSFFDKPSLRLPELQSQSII